MRTFRHPRGPAGLLVGVLLATAAAAMPAAYADPPANDSIRHPVSLTPSTTPYEVQTSEATASRSDGECVGGSSVWYRYQPTATATLRAVTRTNYNTWLAVFTGPRADRKLVNCVDDWSPGVQRTFTAGTTYWIAISRCCSDTKKGRMATLYFYKPVSQTVVTTIESVVAEDVSGQLRVGGTTTCSNPSWTYTTLSARQRRGDGLATGYTEFESSRCGPEGVEWNTTLYNGSGWAFREGQVSIAIDSWASDGFKQAQYSDTRLYPAGVDLNARRR